MAIKTYTSLYKIKEFLVNNIAPKYLSDEEINISQVGLFGYITETLSVLGEDGVNATSIVFKECFANSAENIESLYLMSSIYQLDNYFATAARLPFILILSEEDILKGKSSNGLTTFHIDKNTQFYIEDTVFTLEYDILITAKRTSYKGNINYIYNAQYLMDNKLSFGTVTNPYIKSKVQSYNDEKFVALLIELRQFQTIEYNETVITNDKINYCSFDFNVGNNMVAGFEAFYKSPNPTKSEVQLIKKMENTPKEFDPFCYYTMPAHNTLRISFSNDEKFFVPEFNSTIRILVYTTSGAAGNFPLYTEDEIRIVTVNDRYNENNGLILFGQCAGPSTGGKNSPTMEEFRDQVVAAQSTVKSFSTDNDLAIYFKKINYSGNTKIMFMKREDDSLIRLFNAFTLLIDKDDVIIPTNTCDMYLTDEDLDDYYAGSHRAVIKAGKIYRYINDSDPLAGFKGGIIEDKTINITDDLDQYEDDFLYTNPFLLIPSSKPVNVGVYLNSVNETIQLDTDEINLVSFVQFMTSGLHVYRNAILGEDEYKFSINILPNNKLNDVCVQYIESSNMIIPEGATLFTSSNGIQYIDYKKIRVRMIFTHKKTDLCYIDFELSDVNNQYYTFTGSVKTDDYVDINGKMRLIDSVYNTDGLMDEQFVPSSEIIVRLETYYMYDDTYTFTNSYSTTTNTMDLIKPLNMIRSQLTYQQYLDLEGNDSFTYRIASLPMVKANYVKDQVLFDNFITNITSIYEYLQAEVQRLTNNFSIDIKFYNSYGHSRHYMIDAIGGGEPVYGIDEDKVYLDNINIELEFSIRPYYTTDVENLVKDIKQYILEYLRNDFDNYGNNTYYNSNLIRSLENDFRDKIEYIIFKGINNYPLEVQKLEPIITKENVQTFYDKMYEYVPEYVNIYYKITSGKAEPMIKINIL